MQIIKLLKKLNPEKIFRTIKIIGFCGLALIVLYVFFYFYLKSYPKRHELTKEQLKKATNEFLIEKKEFTPAMVDLPFVKDKQPVKDKNLPIPKKDVDQTIEIEIPSNVGEGFSLKDKKITLVFDKKGNIYRSKDTPKDVKIEAVKWREKFMGLEFCPGYSLVYNGEPFHCFSLNLLRIWKLHFGGELGTNADLKFREFLAGPSVEVKFGEINFLGLKTNLDFTVGKDFINKKYYGGFSLKW